MAAFDVVINNTDRKGGHCLRALADGRIFGIDHGVSFHAQWKLRTVIWDFGGESIPADVCSDLHRFADRPRAASVGDSSSTLLDRFELDALRGPHRTPARDRRAPRRRRRLPLLPLADDLARPGERQRSQCPRWLGQTRTGFVGVEVGVIRRAWRPRSRWRANASRASLSAALRSSATASATRRSACSSASSARSASISSAASAGFRARAGRGAWLISSTVWPAAARLGDRDPPRAGVGAAGGLLAICAGKGPVVDLTAQRAPVDAGGPGRVDEGEGYVVVAHGKTSVTKVSNRRDLGPI